MRVRSVSHRSGPEAGQEAGSVVHKPRSLLLSRIPLLECEQMVREIGAKGEEVCNQPEKVEVHCEAKCHACRICAPHV